MNAPELAALVTGLLLLLPAFWCAVVLLLSHVSGWQRLAASYPAREPPRGTRFAMQSGSVGLVSYRNCLTLHAAPDGLFLSLPFIFRIGHKTLFLPWSTIKNQKPFTFLWYEAISFEMGAAGTPRLRLPAKVFTSAPRTSN